MRLVLETHAGRLQNALPLDIDAFVAVDQDVVDGRVLEQRLERAEAGHLVENFRDEVVELLRIERQPLDQHVLRHQLLDVIADFLFGQLFQRRQIDLFDQPAVQPHLGVEQLVGEQRIGGGADGGLGGGFGEDGPRHVFERGVLGRDEVRSGGAAHGKSTCHSVDLAPATNRSSPRKRGPIWIPAGAGMSGDFASTPSIIKPTTAPATA